MKKKCSGCRKELPISEFATRVIDGEAVPQSRCGTCRAARNKKNKERYEEIKKDAARKNEEGGEVWVCIGCKKEFHISEFPTRTLKGETVSLTRCNSCHKISNKTAEKQRAVEKNKDGEDVRKCHACKEFFLLAFFGTHEWRGTTVPYTKCPPCRQVATAVAIEHQNTDEGQASRKRHRATDKCKTTKREWNRSEVGKTSAKRSRQSDKGRAKMKRALEASRERYHSIPAYREMKLIMSAAHRLIRGITQTSPRFINATPYRDEREFTNHLATTVPPGRSMSEYGPGPNHLQMDHAIPQEAYDYDNPEDILRCWHPNNVRLITGIENKQKMITIDDDLCEQVGVECFPILWDGKIPDEDGKQAFYKRVVEKYNTFEDEGANLDNEESSDEESDEESGEEGEAGAAGAAGSSSEAGEAGEEQYDSDE